jgi:hypothetical protein
MGGQAQTVGARDGMACVTVRDRATEVEAA